MKWAAIRDIEYYLPEKIETNADLQAQFPDWPVERIAEKTGVFQRHVAGEGECASDLAAKAAQKLFAQGRSKPEDIDFVLLCTQSPDFFLPSTSCLLQHRLGIPTSAGALDFNLGCSGYVYGLGLAKGLIETGQASNVLLLTADTYSKFIRADDRSVRTVFGDCGAATWVRGEESGEGDTVWIGPCVWGTDGEGAPNLMAPGGAMRNPPGRESDRHLCMNGTEIFQFTLRRVPQTAADLLARAEMSADQIDLYVFHQAGRYVLEHLRRKMGIRNEKFFVHLEDCGNTVSCSIPVALKEASAAGRLGPGMRVMALGFGVGYSWGGAILTWRG